MKKSVISILLVLCLLSTNILTFAEVNKDETVYVSLKYDGAVDEIKVVNHIYGSGDADDYTDYGSYTKVKNMTDSKEPEVKGDEIKWPMSLLREKNVYYEGTIKKELPIQVKIKYYLDGKETSPEELGGKSGHLKVEISIIHSKNMNWDTAGLVTQIQMTPDLDVFSNIKTEGSRMVVGKKATIAFMALPPEDQSFSFEADGRNIYLDPISITMLPFSIKLPGDLGSSMDKLGEGLDKMDGGASELVKGAEALEAGTERLKTGMVQLDSGIGSLYKGTKELSDSSGSLSTGLDQYYSGLKQFSEQGGQMMSGVDQLALGMETLSQKGDEIYKGFGELKEGVKEISTGNQELSKGLEQLATGHSQLMQLAGMYATSNDPMLRKLAEGIMQEGEALQKLNSGLKESNKGLAAIEGGASQMYVGLGEYNKGIGEAAGGMKEMQKGVSALPSALEQLVTGFEKLQQGLSKYFGGVIEAGKGLGLIKENTKALPRSVDKLVDGQRQLKDGILSLDKGIAEMSQGVSKGIGASLLGSGESSYKSFVDNERNKNSTVQFVMRTPSIDRPKTAEKEIDVEPESKGFFDRLLGLFKKR
ncbi:MAG: hypothetical protein K0R84_94 [Clostridia bacterium]|jgi:X-X-X-Leu-X-X-Gly heptad repeat protein|nr:hypothetical protein [Clostridia bacterium]